VVTVRRLAWKANPATPSAIVALSSAAIPYAVTPADKRNARPPEPPFAPCSAIIARLSSLTPFRVSGKYNACTDTSCHGQVRRMGDRPMTYASGALLSGTIRSSAAFACPVSVPA